MAALWTEAYLEEWTTRGSRAKYEAALVHVPDVGPESYAWGRAGPNKALQPTPYSVRCAPAFRRG